jgi:hypothetical protein
MNQADQSSLIAKSPRTALSTVSESQPELLASLRFPLIADFWEEWVNLVYQLRFCLKDFEDAAK